VEFESDVALALAWSSCPDDSSSCCWSFIAATLLVATNVNTAAFENAGIYPLCVVG
jgi:hypothetical protein